MIVFSLQYCHNTVFLASVSVDTITRSFLFFVLVSATFDELSYQAVQRVHMIHRENSFVFILPFYRNTTWPHCIFNTNQIMSNA